MPAGPKGSPVLDSFTRSDAASLGANWTADISNQAFTSFGITSNQAAKNSGFDSNWWNVSPFAADQEVFCTLSTLPNVQEFRLLACIQHPGGSTVTAYELEIAVNGSDAAIYRRDSDVSRTQLGANLNFTTAAGDQIALVCSGSSHRAFKNTGTGWAPVGTRTDSTYVAVGFIGIWSQNNTAVAIDDFGGGSASELPSQYLDYDWSR